MVSVAEFPDWMLAGSNAALAPAGRPPALRFTVWALPEVIWVPTETVTDCPGWTVIAVGFTEIEKSLPGGCALHVGSPA
jgi:hypothetical protein